VSLSSITDSPVKRCDFASICIVNCDFYSSL
jgi:hypothetical protein